ncbi:hypothetical protein A2W14_01780 [Candidatus Gottesmanbacteria bacterium RBG_16_37_8]|uniref:Uncharacterized protein n=1 Tax=Candidatus Gottesmanbacteria bacterium RBG_16_37_8 TaxID=1798371 RepID=A0A1F5YT57_9BACT|nr:MAG: hypothetical protein A2W14_01780 [Candidatus Gottesmanbacteria bacterium RBG_16_37_8]
MKDRNLNFLKIIKHYEIPLTCLVVLIFIGFLIVKSLIPNIFKAGELKRNGEMLQQKLTILQNKSNVLNSVDERLLKDNFIKLNYIVPDNKDYVLLFTTLDTLQQKLGVSITRTDFQLGVISTSSALLKKSDALESFSVPINLEIIGTIDQLQNFIIELSNLSGRLITTDNIKIEVMDYGLVKANITGNTYFNPLPKEIGAVDSAIPEFNQNYQEIFKKILENQYPIGIIEETKQEVPVGKNNLFL